MLARFILAAAAIAVVAPPALAQSASVQAQSLFDEGRALIKAGKIAEACTAFESSHKLDPAVTTLLNLAECRERNHQIATAWGAFIEANRMARAANNDKLARVATNHARKLEPRLSRLTIAVPPDRAIAGLEVLRDKDQVNPASWNHALPIDGGTYTITARAPGRATWSVTRTVKVESDAQVIEVPRLAEVAPVVGAASGSKAPGPSRPAAQTPSPSSAPVQPSTSPAQTATAPPPPSRPPPPPKAPSQPAITAPRPAERAADAQPVSPGKPAPTPGAAAVTSATTATTTTQGSVDESSQGPSLAWPLGFGAGAIALGVGAIAYEVKGRRLYDQAKDITDVSRRDERDSKERSANNWHRAAQWLGVGAFGCAGVAVYLYIRARSEASPDATAIAPMVAPGLAGLAFSGAW